MRTIAILFCFLVLLVFLPLILIDILISVSFADYWFNLYDFLIYSLVFLILSLIVLRVGSSLGKKFELSLLDFIEGRTDDPRPKPGLLRVYGLLLCLLLPFLLYLLAYAAYAAVVFALLGLWLASMLSMVPVIVLYALGIVAIGAAYGFFVGIYRLFFPPSLKQLGLTITKEEQPALWEAMEAVAKKLHTKPINVVTVTAEPGIGVYLKGSPVFSVFGFGKRVLELGVPSLEKLSVTEFKAVLCHEYGHFDNRDVRWSRFTYAMGRSLVSSLNATPGPQSLGEDSGCVGLIVAFNPGAWILLAFVHLFFRVTSSFSRVREVMADTCSMRHFGGRAFKNALLQIAFNDTLFGKAMEREIVPELIKQGELSSDFATRMARARTSFCEDDLREMRTTLLDNETNEAYDFHPPLAARLQYADRFEDLPEEDETPVTSLFEFWQELSDEVASIYEEHLMTLIPAGSYQAEADPEHCTTEKSQQEQEQ